LDVNIRPNEILSEQKRFIADNLPALRNYLEDRERPVGIGKEVLLDLLRSILYEYGKELDRRESDVEM